MTKENETVSRAQHVALLFEAINKRELAVSKPEFDGMTGDILDALSRIKCPSPSEFETLIAATRHPWVRTMHQLLSEITNDRYPFPFRFKQIGDTEVLCIRPAHVIVHLEAVWAWLPIKNKRVLKKCLLTAGALLVDDKGQPQEMERVGHKKGSQPVKRCNHMVAIKLAVLRGYGLDPSPAVLSASNAASL